MVLQLASFFATCALYCDVLVLASPTGPWDAEDGELRNPDSQRPAATGKVCVARMPSSAGATFGRIKVGVGWGG